MARRLWVVLAVACGQPGHPTGVARQAPASAPAVAPAAAHRIAAGQSFTCVVRSAGTVACWGTNQHGELGHGNLFELPAPATVPGLTGVVDVASSGPSSRVCARTHDRSVWCWGGGEPTPMRIDRLAGADEIAVGTRYACARSGATIRCIGERKAPAIDIAIPFASRIAVGTSRICARTPGGHVACRPLPGAPDGSRWDDTAITDVVEPGLRSALGATTVIELTQLADVVDLAAAGDVMCARTEAGAVWCWSADSKAVGRLEQALPARQLVVGSDTWGCMQSVDHAGCWGYPPQGVAATIVAGIIASDRITPQLAVGAAHACVLAPPETVTCGGRNRFGESGVDPDAFTVRPVEVPELADATALAASDGLTCAVRAGGRITCWGVANVIQSDDRVDLPITGARAVAVARLHACAVVAGGSVACWGESAEGQTGHRDRTRPEADGVVRDFVPRVRGVAGATALALTDDGTCAITAAGIICWGDSGLVANRDRVGPCDPPIAPALCRAQEQPRLAPGTQGAIAIAATRSSVCFARRDGQVGCFGPGHPTVRMVDDITGAVALAAEAEDVCALTADGHARCFDARDLTAPIEVTPRDDLTGRVTSIALGLDHGCAVAGGAVSCWGANDDGQLGDGTLVPHADAAPIGVTDATAVAVGGRHSCALRTSGHVACWGRPHGSDESWFPRAIEPVTVELPR